MQYPPKKTITNCVVRTLIHLQYSADHRNYINIKYQFANLFQILLDHLEIYVNLISKKTKQQCSLSCVISVAEANEPELGIQIVLCNNALIQLVCVCVFLLTIIKLKLIIAQIVCLK